MPATDNQPFPLAELAAISDARYAWVALLLTPLAAGGQHDPDAAQGVQADHPFQAALTLLKTPGAFDLLAPLDIVVPVTAPARLELAQLSSLPVNRVLLRVPAAACADPAAQKKLSAVADAGFRIMIEGVTAGPIATLCGARALMMDAALHLPPVVALAGQPGPHLASHMRSEARLQVCAQAGFSWFTGDFATNPERHGDGDNGSAGDGTTRKRLLALLGLLARDADTHELELLLKQDPSLSYHLLKLVNSAAFALSSPVHSFSQAINVLGRRQLQRWLQLLLYARQQDDGLPNPLLPLAAVRAAQMEALVALQGGDRDRQDMAFVTGVFSLLDVLLGMDMTEIVAALSLDLDVVMALLDRAGPLGDLLKLLDGGAQADAQRRLALADAGIDAAAFWQTQLQAHQWALQVSRSL
ncbi:signal transduction protein [Duganella sp. Leaf126]|uniref:HDOD domain-containing protein n=1 Tax=Duganella sp. Leaf126 TaxID=1736266 RepID=UPI000700CC1A|nr:HDOD domain-containing protein [Duganella sp. Leaf126]KQQ33235.1 signal transduction protein [Duganella sp. Leaf126]